MGAKYDFQPPFPAISPEIPPTFGYYCVAQI
jgi:hypothetical protein